MVRVDQKAFIVASDGMLRAAPMTALSIRNMPFLFDDVLAADEEAHLQDCASIARYDPRQDRSSATATATATGEGRDLLALRDDPHKLPVLRATKGASTYPADVSPKRA